MFSSQFFVSYSEFDRYILKICTKINISLIRFISCFMTFYYRIQIRDPTKKVRIQQDPDPQHSTKYIQKYIMHTYNTVYMRTGKRRGFGLATHDRLQKRVGFGYSWQATEEGWVWLLITGYRRGLGFGYRVHTWTWPESWPVTRNLPSPPNLATRTGPPPLNHTSIRFLL